MLLIHMKSDGTHARILHDDPPPPGCFTFTPRKHAKKVKHFPRP
jgi:hypothetical protein